MSVILAIETATEACSVALLDGARVAERHEIAPRRHAELVLPMVDAVLAEAGVAKRALDAIAVGRGPGAFTGVRLAISIAQGLALALDKPVVMVSTLAALALDAQGDGDAILALIDARMGEVYAGAFERDDDGLVTPVGDETVATAAALVVPERACWIVAGTGYGTYEKDVRARIPNIAGADGAALPHASAIARLAARELAAGRAVDASHAQPVYLRDKVALTLAEQRKA